MKCRVSIGTSAPSWPFTCSGRHKQPEKKSRLGWLQKSRHPQSSRDERFSDGSLDYNLISVCPIEGDRAVETFACRKRIAFSKRYEPPDMSQGDCFHLISNKFGCDDRSGIVSGCMCGVFSVTISIAGILPAFGANYDAIDAFRC